MQDNPTVHEPERGVIVVGLDDSEGGRAALATALDLAVAAGAPLQVITAWIWQSPYETLATSPTFEQSKKATEETQEQILDEVLSGRDQVPVVSRLVVHADPGRALVLNSEGARMLVVGSGRKGLLSRAIMGSVSEYCVRHSSVPVLVVPDPSRVTGGDERVPAQATAG